MELQPTDRPAIPKIACIEFLAPEVRAEIRAIAEPDFEIQFVESNDPADHYDVAADAEFLLVGGPPVTASLLERCPRLRLIQKFGVGLDNIDIEAIRRAGVPLAIAAGINAQPVSELALGLMIAVNRRMLFADRMTRQGVSLRTEMRSSCLQLDGQTVGLLGFGASGRMVARRLAGFDVEILYHSRRRADSETEQALRARYVTCDELLSRSDILSLHVPLTATTHHMINAQTLRKMKPGAILINTCRGRVVDEAALYAALVDGTLRGAGLDVLETEPANPDNPLFRLQNIVVTPHVGGGAFNNVGRVMRHAIGNMRKLLAGEPLPPADVIVPLEAARR
jgi:D-3-phosphoglycerate dehydrogenase